YLRLIITHQNVTDIKRAQIELHDSNRRLEAILDNLADGIITFDKHGVIETINPAGALIFGYQPYELVGQPVKCLIPAVGECADGEPLTAFVTQLDNQGNEAVGLRRDGTLFPIYFAVSQLKLDRQRLFTGIIQDVTERKFLEAQVIEKRTPEHRAGQRTRTARPEKSLYLHDVARTADAAVGHSTGKQYAQKLRPPAERSGKIRILRGD
ncbi:MAG TPA: PAS domain S-box protein, partial [Phototrophicaceae bacterium]|nr:PAS domain S-box protein [Phototrophicaceae bacterium]